MTLFLFCYIFSFFKDSIHKWNYMIFVFLWLISPMNNNISPSLIPSRSIHVVCKWQDFICFYGWVVFHLEKAMAPHPSTLAWKIPCMEEPGRLQSMGSLRVGHDWATHFHISLSCIGEGNGNPLQCSCLENPRDRGAWWAAIHGVAESQTRLKRLSSSSSSSSIPLPIYNTSLSIHLLMGTKRALRWLPYIGYNAARNMQVHIPFWISGFVLFS